MRLTEAEFAEIRSGNCLIISCQGDGGKHCGGWLRIPFSPALPGCSEPEPLKNGMVWKRTGGETLEDLSLSPSIDADVCGHFFVENGQIR